MMTTAYTEGSILVIALGWTLLYSLLQGALVSTCLWIILKTLTQTQARLKYHISLLALLSLAGWFVVTLFQQWSRLQSVVVMVTETAKETGVQTTHRVTAAPVQSAFEQLLTTKLPGMESLFTGLVVIYCLGIVAMIIRLAAGLVQIYQLSNRNAVAPDPQLEALFRILKERMNIPGRVRFFQSYAAQVPMVLGLFKPVILLPFSMASGLNAAQLEAILLHELAHIKRHDYLVNILQTIIETILFFNPFLWWISAGIRKEREHCCDDLVLAETLEPLPYATALATLEAHRYAAQSLALAATGSNKHHLLNRIKRFTEMKRTPLNYSKVAAGILTVGLVTGAAIWLTPALAQDKKPATHSSTTKVQKVIIVDDQGNKKEYGSFDDVPEGDLQELKKSLGHVDKELERSHEQLSKLDDQLRDSYTPWTNGKTQKIVEDAMNSVDWDKINAETSHAIALARKEIKNVDWNKVDDELAGAMKEIDHIDWDAIAAASKDGKTGAEISAEVRRQVEDARKMAYDAVASIHIDAKNERRNHRAELPEPPAPPAPPAGRHGAAPPPPPPPPNPAQDYDDMLAAMDRDGLIDQERGFDIRKDSENLYINGKEQPDAVKVKYRRYFSKGKVHISGTRDDLNISATSTR